MRRVLTTGLLVVALVGVYGSVQAADDTLARARQLYNEGKFEAAVQAAELARTPEQEHAADLIAARALLERFRGTASGVDLSSARERLRRLDPERLNQSERVEYLVGLGEQLFFEGTHGAAASVFDSVLASPRALPLAARERVLDWWANAVDRDARPRSELDRLPIYQRILDRMRTEQADNPASSVAPFWLAAAACGQGDHHMAWSAAHAGWARAMMTADRGAELREQLDLLVIRTIIPQRARALAQPPESLLQDWDGFKEKWTR